MSKWKCGICNSEFDNFQAQGFGGTIYCPLCYFKELYRRTKIERDRVNNIINRIDNFVDRTIELIKQQPSDNDEWILERLNGIKHLIELKENNKDAC